MRRYKTDKQHPCTIIDHMITKPRDRLIPDRFVVGIVFRVACADLAKPYNVVPGSGDRIAHRSPYLSDSIHQMHWSML